MKGHFLKFCVLILYLLILSCDIWERRYQPNPNLEPLMKNDWDSFFNPVWSPDGRYIYYLRAHRDRLPTIATSLAVGGELWRVNLETKEKKFLLAGPFCSLAISHDGSLLALSYEMGDNEMEWEGGPLILGDTSGNILDTLPTSLPLILDVEFSSNDTKLYYYAYGSASPENPPGFYRINIDGSGEELIKENYNHWNMKFGLDYRDSIYIGKWNFNPLKIDYAVVTGYVVLGGPSEIYIVRLSTSDTLIPDADPYGPPEDPSGFESAYWSPDGEELVLSVGEVEKRDVMHALTLELWNLHNVWGNSEN